MRDSVSAEAIERTADQSHPRDVAGTAGQAAEAAPQPREGGRAIQVLQARRPKHQDQGYAPVSSFLWHLGRASLKKLGTS